MVEQANKVEVAKRYLARGWSVLPLRPRDKRPLIPWADLQNNRPSEREIVDWLRRWPEANVGIVTGEISNLIVLDVDPKHGGDDALERLERRYRPLPDTVEAITGGGGRHFYFTQSGLLTRSRAGLAQGIDLRGDGGYIVATPSIHPSGRLYEWVPGHGPDEIDLAPFVATRHREPWRCSRRYRQPRRRQPEADTASGSMPASAPALHGDRHYARANAR
jgi:hypothetical protein